MFSHKLRPSPACPRLEFRGIGGGPRALVDEVWILWSKRDKSKGHIISAPKLLAGPYMCGYSCPAALNVVGFPSLCLLHLAFKCVEFGFPGKFAGGKVKPPMIHSPQALGAVVWWGRRQSKLASCDLIRDKDESRWRGGQNFPGDGSHSSEPSLQHRSPRWLCRYVANDSPGRSYVVDTLS